MPWEYLKAQLSTTSSGNDLQIVVNGGCVDANELGAQNYELVAVVHETASDPTSNNVGIFKRFVENKG